MKKITLLSLLFTGCAVATTQPTYSPDGSHAHSINCSGSARTWGMCYEKAGEICKERGYEIVGGGTDQNALLLANGNGAFAGKSNSRSMLIKCK